MASITSPSCEPPPSRPSAPLPRPPHTHTAGLVPQRISQPTTRIDAGRTTRLVPGPADQHAGLPGTGPPSEPSAFGVGPRAEIRARMAAVQALTNAGLGLDYHALRLERTTEGWVAAGSSLRNEVSAAVSAEAACVEQVGSSSVVGLLAKHASGTRMSRSSWPRPTSTIARPTPRARPESWAHSSARPTAPDLRPPMAHGFDRRRTRATQARPAVPQNARSERYPAPDRWAIGT